MSMYALKSLQFVCLTTKQKRVSLKVDFCSKYKTTTNLSVLHSNKVLKRIPVWNI